MDPSGVQAARQTSLAEKKRRIKSPTQQVSAPSRVYMYFTTLYFTLLLFTLYVVVAFH